MTNEIADDTRTMVRDHYAKVSTDQAGCAPGCCAVARPDQSKLLGYSDAERDAVGDGADLGLGCGNPTAIASLRASSTSAPAAASIRSSRRAPSARPVT